MIIVAGHLTVDPDRRAEYLEHGVKVIAAARAAPGCIAFTLSGDPIEAERINVFEQWTSVDAVESFRGSGPDDDQTEQIRSADVVQYEIASEQRLT